MLTLYSFAPSTTSQKVRLCLAYKGVEFTDRAVDLGQLEHLEPWYVALNPRAELPTLVADNLIVTESSIINEYLDDRFPEPPLMPRDPVLRARVRMWNRYVDAGATVAIAQPTYQYWVRPAVIARRDEFEARVARMPVAQHRERWRRILADGIDDATLAEAFDVVAQLLGRMEQQLADGPFLVGDVYTLADVETTPIVVRVEHLERLDLVADKPRVRGWLDRVRAMPNFARTFAA